MKKVVVAAICICLLVLGYEQSRKFIRIDGDNWVTVWKRYGNKCLAIPGRYYGITKPNTPYLLTENTTLINLFLLSASPNTIVFRTKSKVEVINESNAEFLWNYHSDEERLKSLIYTNEDPSKVRDDVKSIFVDIHDSVAMNGDGERLW